MEPLCLEYRPHIERAGFHTDRFDVLLDDQPILGPTRSPLYATARELLKRGFEPDRLMTIRLTGRDYDSFEPRPIGELAKWTVQESDRGGLQRREWVPFPVGVAEDER